MLQQHVSKCWWSSLVVVVMVVVGVARRGHGMPSGCGSLVYAQEIEHLGN